MGGAALAPSFSTIDAAAAPVLMVGLVTSSAETGGDGSTDASFTLHQNASCLMHSWCSPMWLGLSYVQAVTSIDQKQ
jgi:hypothetical protein